LCNYLAWLPAKERTRFSSAFLAGNTPADSAEVRAWREELRAVFVRAQEASK
jgi:hypothetical protein